MGLGLAFLRNLIELKRAGVLEGATRVAEIGDQQLADNLIAAPELAEAYRLFGCSSPPQFQPVGAENFTERAPSSRLFWASLGLERVAIDLVGDAVPLDLNFAGVPRRLRGSFDLVVNAGTTEHVANQANAFAVVHDLCRLGGVMYHELPAAGPIDHGLISYQPKFFRRLIEYNDYEEIFLRFATHGVPPLPDHLRSEYARDDVAECALRIAARKRRPSSFAVPLDVRPQPPEVHAIRHAGVFGARALLRNAFTFVRLRRP